MLDDVRNLTGVAADAIDEQIGRPSGEVSLPGGTAAAAGTGNIAADVADIILPSTSDILYGIIDGSIAGTLWDSLTSSTGSVASYVLRLAADNTTGAMSNIWAGWARAQATSATSTARAPPSTPASSTRCWPGASRSAAAPPARSRT